MWSNSCVIAGALAQRTRNAMLTPGKIFPNLVAELSV
jgi:hypothetical protein